MQFWIFIWSTLKLTYYLYSNKETAWCFCFSISFSYFIRKGLIFFDESKFKYPLLHCLTEDLISLFPKSTGQPMKFRTCVDKEITVEIFCTCRIPWRKAENNTVKPLNSGHLRVLKHLSVIERCPLLGDNFKKIAIFGTERFVRYSWHVRYLGCLLLGAFTVESSKCFHGMCQRIPEEIFMKQNSKTEWFCRSCLNSKWNSSFLTSHLQIWALTVSEKNSKKRRNWQGFFFCISST